MGATKRGSTNVEIRNVEAESRDKVPNGENEVARVLVPLKVEKTLHHGLGFYRLRRLLCAGNSHGNQEAAQHHQCNNPHGPREPDLRYQMRQQNGQEGAADATAAGDQAHGERSALLEVLAYHRQRGLRVERNSHAEQDSLGCVRAPARDPQMVEHVPETQTAATKPPAERRKVRRPSSNMPRRRQGR